MRLVLVIAACGLAGAAAAQVDSSTDAPDGFLDQVKESKGVVLRVPINRDGEENTAAAELRLHTDGEDVRTADSIVRAWEESESLADMPEVAEDDVKDSSTWGWGRYRHGHWTKAYYYLNYRPRYYYGGYTYRYGSPYYYSSDDRSYRYYYYGCY